MTPKKRELGRADRIQAGIWRLRLPLPWTGVPHVNAFAIAAGSGVVLVDTGMDEPGALGQLERALAQAGLRLEHIRLVICTHAHSDHYGLAGPIVDAAGCELWMHPNHGHLTRAAQDPERMLERRIEVGRQSGVPEEALQRYHEARRGEGIGVARVVEPDRDLVEGVEVETDLGRWQVVETPGHAPSHVVLHQPERGLLLSGDHVLGRVSLYYDYGYTPDPAGEYLASLDRAEQLDATLCLAGHGRAFRSVNEKIAAFRTTVLDNIETVRRLVAEGPKTPFEIVPGLLGTHDVSPMMVNWALSQILCYLRYLELREEAVRVEGEDPAERWALAA
ncbi:MAG TPA: MBL fold metallo-hydrolase [Thermoleophilaceae bacterium]|nr:MBL fold metallo-hydrolase [Thermoleophilaceae bacterium]